MATKHKLRVRDRLLKIHKSINVAKDAFSRILPITYFKHTKCDLTEDLSSIPK